MSSQSCLLKPSLNIQTKMIHCRSIFCLTFALYVGAISGFQSPMLTTSFRTSTTARAATSDVTRRAVFGTAAASALWLDGMQPGFASDIETLDTFTDAPCNIKLSVPASWEKSEQYVLYWPVYSTLNNALCIANVETYQQHRDQSYPHDHRNFPRSIFQADIFFNIIFFRCFLIPFRMHIRSLPDRRRIVFFIEPDSDKKTLLFVVRLRVMRFFWFRNVLRSSEHVVFLFHFFLYFIILYKGVYTSPRWLHFPWLVWNSR